MFCWIISRQLSCYKWASRVFSPPYQQSPFLEQLVRSLSTTFFYKNAILVHDEVISAMTSSGRHIWTHWMCKFSETFGHSSRCQPFLVFTCRDCSLKKTTEQLYFLKQLKRAGLPPTQLVHFYLAVIRPVLEYAAPIWHHLLTKTQSDLLEAIQKRAIRIIYQCDSITYTNVLYLAQFSSLSSRREELCRCFFNTTRVMLTHSPPTSTRSYNSYTTHSCCKISSNNYPN